MPAFYWFIRKDRLIAWVNALLVNFNNFRGNHLYMQDIFCACLWVSANKTIFVITSPDSVSVIDKKSFYLVFHSVVFKSVGCMMAESKRIKSTLVSSAHKDLFYLL